MTKKILAGKKVLPQWYGNESAQRKRFLKSEEHELKMAFGSDWRKTVSNQMVD